MKRAFFFIVVLAAIGAGAYYYTRADVAQATDTSQRGGGRQGGQGGGGFGGGPGGFGGGGGFGGPRLPMTVELASVKRAELAQEVTVVGNLIGMATVEAVPKVGGRLESVSVRLGDRVTKGQRIAKIEDSQITEQVKQAQAAYEVALATIHQREALLKQAQANLDRSKNLYERQLIPKQTFDDTDASYQAAAAQLELANAQYAQAQARLEELKVTLEETDIVSPVSGFIGKRVLDPGAWVTPNSSFISVVDIGIVRLVANVVEKDLRKIAVGAHTDVEVDALPGETFSGRVARIAPILDPATRTAAIEIEIDNPQYHLKPGMFAKVHFKVDRRENVLAIPTTALVDVGGERGVFVAAEGDQGTLATFRKLNVGLISTDLVEVVSGLSEGDRVITTGAAGLREGDRIVLPGQSADPDRRPGGGARGGRGGRRGGAGGGRAS